MVRATTCHVRWAFQFVDDEEFVARQHMYLLRAGMYLMLTEFLYRMRLIKSRPPQLKQRSSFPFSPTYTKLDI